MDNIENENEVKIPQIKLTDNIFIEHRNDNGELLTTKSFRNLITTIGKAGLASRINGIGAEPVFSYAAIGIGVTAANAADTILGSEITTGGGQRALATLSRVTITATNDTAQFVVTYNFTSAFAVTEAGIFNNATAGLGTLLARKVFSPMNVVSGDSITLTWQIQVA